MTSEHNNNGDWIKQVDGDIVSWTEKTPRGLHGQMATEDMKSCLSWSSSQDSSKCRMIEFIRKWITAHPGLFTWKGTLKWGGVSVYRHMQTRLRLNCLPSVYYNININKAFWLQLTWYAPEMSRTCHDDDDSIKTKVQLQSWSLGTGQPCGLWVVCFWLPVLCCVARSKVLLAK